MKYLLILSVLVLSSVSLEAQTTNYNPALDAPQYLCFAPCFDRYGGTSNGNKYGIGVGLTKELSPRFDLSTNLAFNIWTFGINDTPYYNSYQVNLINLAVGTRYHIFKFTSSSIYAGLTFNVQSYFDSPSFVNFALTGTASVGWNKKIGEKLDFFAAVGFDKNISNVREYGKFSDAAKIYPGKLAFDLGFNFRLGKKAAEIAD